MATREVIRRTALRHADGTFVRASAAYLPTAAGMTAYGNNEPRTLTQLATNRANPQIVLDDIGPGEHSVPLCYNGTYLFAVKSGTNALYRSATGAAGSWTLVTTLAVTPTGFWATSTGRLIYAYGDGGYIKIKTSDDNGATWSAVRHTFTTANAIVDYFSFAEANGVLLLSEYSAPGNTGRYIYRSTDDGTTWTIVADAEALQAGGVTHWHAGGYHAGLGRWVWAAGDGTQRLIAYSDDNGATWALLTPGNIPYLQPVGWIDYGHPTRMGFASDAQWEVGTVNIDGTAATERTILPVLTWDRRNRVATGYVGRYCFRLEKLGGVYYAFAWNNIVTPQAAYVSVSLDFVNWVNYATLPVLSAKHPIGVNKQVALVNGLLHFSTYWPDSAVWRHVTMEPAVISSKTGLLIEPARTNLLATADAACTALSADSYWEAYATGNPAGTISLVTTEGHNPGDTSCVKLHMDAAQVSDKAVSFAKRLAGASYATGDMIALSWWMKGIVHMIEGKWLRSDYAQVTDSNEEMCQTWSPLTVAGNWLEMTRTPCVAPNPATYNHLKAWTTLYGLGYDQSPPMLGDCDVYIDSIMAVKNTPARVTWGPGGTALAADSLSFTGVNTQTCWTHVRRVILRCADYDLRPVGALDKLGLLYLWSYYTPNWIPTSQGTVLRVYYDTADSTFVLHRQDVGGSGASSSSKTGAVSFGRDTECVFIVRRFGGTSGGSTGNSRFTLTVLVGGTLRTTTGVVTDSAESDCVYGPLTIRTGNYDGSAVMPMVLIDGEDWMYDGALSDEQVETRLEKALVAQSDRGSGGGRGLWI